jgi:hypothetical protein
MCMNVHKKDSKIQVLTLTRILSISFGPFGWILSARYSPSAQENCLVELSFLLLSIYRNLCFNIAY